MPYLASAWSAEHPHFTNTKWRERIVEHKGFRCLSQQRLHSLFITGCTKRRSGKRLGFASGEEGGAVCTGEDPHPAIDGPDVVEGSPVDPDTFGTHHRSHGLFFHL